MRAPPQGYRVPSTHSAPPTEPAPRPLRTTPPRDRTLAGPQPLPGATHPVQAPPLPGGTHPRTGRTLPGRAHPRTDRARCGQRFRRGGARLLPRCPPRCGHSFRWGGTGGHNGTAPLAGPRLPCLDPHHGCGALVVRVGAGGGDAREGRRPVCPPVPPCGTIAHTGVGLVRQRCGPHRGGHRPGGGEALSGGGPDKAGGQVVRRAQPRSWRDALRDGAAAGSTINCTRPAC